MLQTLAAAALATIDSGRLGIAFDHALDRVRTDMLDRPGVAAARTVTLTLTLSPKADDAGDLAGADVSFTVRESIPKRSTKPYSLAATRGGFYFNDLSAEDVRQRTLDDTGPRIVDNGDGTETNIDTGETAPRAATGTEGGGA